MEDELRILHEAMVVKDRLRVLAELQASYWDELLERGFEPSLAEQLVLEWSRLAYGMTFRAVPEPTLDADLDALLSTDDGAFTRPTSGSDPSRVPPGEPWLQLVQEVDDEDGRDERAA